MNDRLTKDDWLRHGLRTLAGKGPGALQVAPLSTQMQVSRGSFYWHFRDLSDFKAQVLQRWAETTTEAVQRELQVVAAPSERLRLLITRVFGARRTLDRAIRAWAATDEAVAAVVASVDVRRVAYITDLLRAAGVDEPVAKRRGAFLYWALLGQAFVMDPAQAALAGSDLDDICALLES